MWTVQFVHKVIHTVMCWVCLVCFVAATQIEHDEIEIFQCYTFIIYYSVTDNICSEKNASKFLMHPIALSTFGAHLNYHV